MGCVGDKECRSRYYRVQNDHPVSELLEGGKWKFWYRGMERSERVGTVVSKVQGPGLVLSLAVAGFRSLLLNLIPL